MRRAILAAITGTVAIAVTCAGQQGSMDSVDRGRTEFMLQQVRSELLKHYYDDKFHGLDIEARYQLYRKKIDQAQTVSDGMRVVEAFLAGLNDSHTVFQPPLSAKRSDYGYVPQIIGDRCYVTQVRPGSDAATKLQPGDEILALNGYTVNRGDLSELWYALNELQPVTATKVNRRSLDGNLEEMTIKATLSVGKVVRDFTLRMGDDDYIAVKLAAERRMHALRQRHVETGDLMMWKMPAFVMPQNDLGHIIGLAREHKALIVDLRGNPGGVSDVVEHLVGSVVDHEIPIAQRVGRKPMKPSVSVREGAAFGGDMIVLVDSRTASAAEVFARTMQLNHRATVIGDRTAGAVMEANYYPLNQGFSFMMLNYGVFITDADLVMPDGQSLENHGVTPDETVLPSREDLAAGRDPVLAYAAGKLGVKLDAKAAVALFPFEWTPLGDQ